MHDADGSEALRIGLVGPAGPWRGGIAHYVDALSETLAGRGHDTRIVSFRRQYPALLFPGTTQMEIDGVSRPETERSLDTLNPLSWRAAGRALAAWCPAGVLFNYWLPFFVPTYAGVARQIARAGSRVFFDCHNVLPHERRPFDGPLTRWMLKLPDAFIVHSSAVRDDLLRLRPAADVTVTPLPLSADFPDGPGRARARSDLGLPADGAVLLFFGFIRAYKGLDVAIDALSRLPTSTHLVVAGEFYDRKEPYLARIADAGLAGRVRLHDGYIPRDRVGTYFDAADVVVLPYHRATQSGILPLAWRYRTPVVATRVGGLTELIKDGVNGVLIPPGDPEALSEAVKSVLESDLANELRDGIDRSRDAFSWPRLGEVIERAVRGRPPGR